MALAIKYKKDTDAKDPCYAYEGDAGLDIFSNEEKVIEPHHRATIKTGLYFEIPNNHVGLVWDKSGLALKQGFHTMSGVLDCNYRGELKVILVNLSSQARKIEKGVKVAQLLIQKVETASLKEVSGLSETTRGEKGFGSSGLTGKKEQKEIKDDFISEIKEEIEKPKSKSKRKKIAMKRGLKEIRAKIKR